MVHLFNLETFMNQSQSNTEIATLGGGCFWCLEAVYDELRGILSVESGYSGGTVLNPTYRQVTTGQTGHAEVVQITYDPAVISFRDILHVFFTIHDPTTLNRQGADAGTQYRSAIYYHSEEQQEIAQEVIAEMADGGLWQNAIVTEVTPFDIFYVAEDYHQDYYREQQLSALLPGCHCPQAVKSASEISSTIKEVTGIPQVPVTWRI